ncbi:MAG TPA: YdcF family protein [Acidimicrobiales bacterium]|nr:YdcF family protein [Acidimicrobiales bacterium]
MRWGRGILITIAALVGFLVLYIGVTFVQVWMSSRHDGAKPADAIVVLGAAQYNGRPSPVLISRLDHALDLWNQGLAPLIVVTGGKQPGDRFTEATASANYLIQHGVPDEKILREVQGTSSWESLAAAARILKGRGLSEVILVSDPYHSLRIGGIADELGLTAHVSPTRTSPIRGSAELRHMVRETGAVAVGRIIGYRRLLRLEG